MPSETKLIPALALILATASPVLSQTETRLPIISRVEVMYSVVSHHSHVGSHRDFYNQNGGNASYAVPFLVYEPIVTLYNPYNTPLTITKCRVSIANPPVGFRFRKNDVYLRQEWNNGGPFHGLGRFQIENESNPAAQKTITLLLRNRSDPPGYPGGSFVLQPGQAIPFSTWVESNWSWGLETGNGVNGSRAFFDFSLANDRTNKDRRTNNQFGVETLLGMHLGGGSYAHDFRAGFQTWSLSVSSGRPAATRYPFETGEFGTTSWVAIRNSDFLRVEARGTDTVQDPLVPDFQLSLMAGNSQSPETDTLKSYSFTLGDLDQPATATPGLPVIDRTFRVGEMLQQSTDSSVGGKTPIAAFVMVARAAALHQKKFQAATQPPASELYETRLEERNDFYNGFPYGGPSDHTRGGVFVTGFERLGNFLMMDVAAEPFRSPMYWKVMGGSDPGEMTTDLTSATQIMEGPQGTGIYKLKVTLPPDSPKYFVKLAW